MPHEIRLCGTLEIIYQVTNELLVYEPVSLCIPIERYGQYAQKTNNQLKVNPVANQVSKQSVEARSHRPEVLDD